MTALWGSLVPLILGSALVPIQVMITLLLLRSKSGKMTAVAFVGGLTFTRLLQGGVFGLVLSNSTVESTKSGPGVVLSVVILLTGILLLVTGLKQVFTTEDPDAPPPKWLVMTETMTPLKAFAVGAGMLLLQVKFWLFTLGALSAIGAANVGQPSATVYFIVFVILAESLSIIAVTYAYLAPRQSSAVLERAAGWLRAHNRVLVIALGVIFGVWFTVKGLVGLGVL